MKMRAIGQLDWKSIIGQSLGDPDRDHCITECFGRDVDHCVTEIYDQSIWINA